MPSCRISSYRARATPVSLGRLPCMRMSLVRSSGQAAPGCFSVFIARNAATAAAVAPCLPRYVSMRRASCASSRSAASTATTCAWLVQAMSCWVRRTKRGSVAGCPTAVQGAAVGRRGRASATTPPPPLLPSLLLQLLSDVPGRLPEYISCQVLSEGAVLAAGGAAAAPCCGLAAAAATAPHSGCPAAASGRLPTSLRLDLGAWHAAMGALAGRAGRLLAGDRQPAGCPTAATMRRVGF